MAVNLSVLDLFSGIGGFSLGLDRAIVPNAPRFKTVAFCEADEYCRRVLGHHWPRVPCYPDVRHLGLADFLRDGVALPDVICGGSPCQDISGAGRGEGLGTEEDPTDRSGLWFQYRRIIEEFRPSWVIIENVPMLRSRGLDVVLGGLGALGYDAWWDGISAGHLGAPHRRDRIWIVAADADSDYGRSGWPWRSAANGTGQRESVGSLQDVADTAGERPDETWGGRERSEKRITSCGTSLADTDSQRRAKQPRNLPQTSRRPQSSDGRGQTSADTDSARHAFWARFRGYVGEELAAAQRDCVREGGTWGVEPDLGRLAHGLPFGVVKRGRKSRAKLVWEAQLKALGNSLVWPIPAALGRAVLRLTLDTQVSF